MTRRTLDDSTLRDTSSTRRTLSEVTSLQATMDKRLGLDDMQPARRYRNGGKLLDDNKLMAEKVLAAYDGIHAPKLLREAKMLGDGGTLANASVPAVFERTVIREALYNMVGLQFTNYGTAEFGESLYIPYSYRKTSAAAGVNDTRTYEGNGIQRASVVQDGETAYPIPQKLSFEVTDELRYITSAKRLDWEVVSENQANAARIIGEDTDRLIFNELVQASDEYQAGRVLDEDLASQVDSGKRVVLIGGGNVTTVCRPRKVFDLQGNQIGNTINPVTMLFDGEEIQEFDVLAFDDNGNSTLPAGFYYVLDYDIGECWIVDQDGGMVDPAGKTWRISYGKASNLAYFDIDVPAGSTPEKHWNGFLRLYGLRKTLIEDTRHYQVTFGLMSGNTMNEIEQAEKFQANNQVNATHLDSIGSLGLIKNVPNYKTAVPGSWVGDRRVIIGERGVTRLRITKPWTMGAMDNQRDSTGRFTGKKEAYGDQFIVLHTPKFLKSALTSIVLYSKSQRVARAA